MWAASSAGLTARGPPPSSATSWYVSTGTPPAMIGERPGAGELGGRERHARRRLPAVRRRRAEAREQVDGHRERHQRHRRAGQAARPPWEGAAHRPPWPDRAGDLEHREPGRLVGGPALSGRPRAPAAVADPRDRPVELRRERDVEERGGDRVAPEAVAAQRPVRERVAHGHQVEREQVERRDDRLGDRRPQHVQHQHDGAEQPRERGDEGERERQRPRAPQVRQQDRPLAGPRLLPAQLLAEELAVAVGRVRPRLGAAVVAGDPPACAASCW